MSASSVRALLIALCLALLPGCAASPYVTAARQSEIAGVKGRKLCLISFRADPDIGVTGGSVLTGMLRAAAENKERESQLAGKLAAAHLHSLVSEFSNQFPIVGPTDLASLDNTVSLADKTAISNAIAKAGAHFGLIVSDEYGWSWAPAEAGISNYQVETRVSIVNRKADLVWMFHSTALLYPRPSVNGVLSGVTATTPDDAAIIAFYSDFFERYPRVVLKLIEEDSEGKPHRARFEDYVSDAGSQSRIVLVSESK